MQRSNSPAIRVFGAAIAAASLLAVSPSSAQQLGYTGSYTSAPAYSPYYAPYSPAPVVQRPRPRKEEAEKRSDSKSRSVSFDLGVATEVPLFVGGQATLELPYGILFQGQVGVLPATYVNAVDGILTSANAYDAFTSSLIRDALGDSMVVELSGGWRPFEDHGLELLGGYTLLSFGGGFSARQTIEGATGATLPAEIPDAQIALHSTVHGVHASIGWRWLFGDHVVLRTSLGYMQAVTSSSHVDVPASITSNPMVAAQMATVNQTVDSTLDGAYTKYMKLPLLAMSLSYRF